MGLSTWPNLCRECRVAQLEPHWLPEGHASVSAHRALTACRPCPSRTISIMSFYLAVTCEAGSLIPDFTQEETEVWERNYLSSSGRIQNRG